MTLAAVFTPGSAFTFAASAHARKGFGYTFAFAAFIYTCEGSGSFSFLSSRLAGLMSIFSTVFWMLAILYLETYTRYWERINDGNILTPFRNALYAARRSNMICFRSLEDVDISFDCQKEILYGDTYYYTSTALLKKIIKVQLRSYMPSDVLNRLKTAGVLSGSVPKTLTFAPNESKDFRFRTLLRSSLHQPGSRDLVEI